MEVYLTQPNTVAIVAVRNPTTARDLKDLLDATGKKLIIVKIGSIVGSDPAAALVELQHTYNITKLDILIANAGLSKSYAPVAELTVVELRNHTRVNAIGPAYLIPSPVPSASKGSGA